MGREWPRYPTAKPEVRPQVRQQEVLAAWSLTLDQDVPCSSEEGGFGNKRPARPAGPGSGETRISTRGAHVVLICIWKQF